MEDVSVNGSWNKKRIFAAVFLLTLLIVGVYLVKTRVLGEETSQSPSREEPRSVKGAAVTDKTNNKEDLGISIKESVREKINVLKQEVLSLDVAEIASSSPQVQKILKDIQALEQYPVNQAKELCRQICGL